MFALYGEWLGVAVTDCEAWSTANQAFQRNYCAAHDGRTAEQHHAHMAQMFADFFEAAIDANVQALPAPAAPAAPAAAAPPMMCVIAEMPSAVSHGSTPAVRALALALPTAQAAGAPAALDEAALAEALEMYGKWLTMARADYEAMSTADASIMQRYRMSHHGRPMSSTMSTWQTCMRLSLRRRSAIHCSMHQQRRLRQPRQPRQQHRPHQATSGHIRPHQATSGRIRPHQASSTSRTSRISSASYSSRASRVRSTSRIRPHQAISGRIRPHQASSTSSTSRISSASYSSRASRVRSTSRIGPRQAVHQQQPHQPSPYRASPYCRAYRQPRSQLSKRCPQRHRIAWSQLCPRLTSKSVLRLRRLRRQHCALDSPRHGTTASPYRRASRLPRSQLSQRCPQRHRMAWSSRQPFKYLSVARSTVQQPHQPSPYRASPYRLVHRSPRSQLSKRCLQRHRMAWSSLGP